MNRPDDTRSRALLDMRGVANHLFISVRQVRRLVAENRLPHIKIGRLVRFDPDQLDAWVQAQGRGPERPTAA